MEEKTFEEALAALDVIVKDLESGNIELEKAIEKYTEAMKLVKLCSDKLNAATEAVNKIALDNGELKDFEIAEDNKDE